MAKLLTYFVKFKCSEDRRQFISACNLLSRGYTTKHPGGGRIHPPFPHRTDSPSAAAAAAEDDDGRSMHSHNDHKIAIDSTNKRNDRRFRKIVDQIRGSSKREKLGMSFILGESLVRESLRMGCSLKEVFYCDRQNLRIFSSEWLNESGVPCLQLSKDLFNSCLNTKLASDGIMAVISLPLSHDAASVSDDTSPPLTVICDNVRDPGNMGILIQSTAATSSSRILTTKGCVDAWEPKVLQMGCGAHFHSHIKSGLDWNEIDSIVSPDTKLFLADSSGPKEVSPPSETLDPDRSSGIPLRNYSSVGYHGDPTAVIIGGETEGVSHEAFEFCRRRSGLSNRIHIPMMERVNSLNSAVAGSVILFEIARQRKLCSQGSQPPLLS